MRRAQQFDVGVGGGGFGPTRADYSDDESALTALKKLALKKSSGEPLNKPSKKPKMKIKKEYKD